MSEGSPSARLGLPADITLDVWHRRTSRADLATHKPNSSTLIYPFVFSELMFGVITVGISVLKSQEQVDMPHTINHCVHDRFLDIQSLMVGF